MSDKKSFTIAAHRHPNLPIQRVVFGGSFSIRAESAAQRMLEVLIQPSIGSLPVACVVFDATTFRENGAMFGKYLAELRGTADDGALSDKLPYNGQTCYSNMLQCSHSSERTETLFGLTTIQDVASLKRTAESGKEYAVYYEVPLVVYGSIGFQKKLISEMLRVLK